jgi:hypothetical protein
MSARALGGLMRLSTSCASITRPRLIRLLHPFYDFAKDGPGEGVFSHYVAAIRLRQRSARVFLSGLRGPLERLARGLAGAAKFAFRRRV